MALRNKEFLPEVKVALGQIIIMLSWLSVTNKEL
jgi:hypothetical protein